MLSFRFELTAAQVRMLLAIYAGDWLPNAKHLRAGMSSTEFGIGAAVRARLEEKGLTKRIVEKAEHGSAVGFEITQRGRVFCETIVEDAERIIAQVNKGRKRRVA